jgi:hypothetical protein
MLISRRERRLIFDPPRDYIAKEQERNEADAYMGWKSEDHMLLL